LAHQVFVSYATEDADTASRLCGVLEAEGIKCWVAPRDVKAGTDYAAAIMDAVRNSQLAVLVFSVHSNVSPYTLREIERAFAYGQPVLALRIDSSKPSPSLEYHVHEWIVAKEGVEDKRKEIVTAARRLLDRPTTATSRRRKIGAIVAAAVVALVAVALGLGLGLTCDRAASQPGTTGDLVTWTELESSGTLPSPRSDHSMANDPVSGRLVMFGGYTGKEPRNDTWAYDPVANTWAGLAPSGTLPSPRSGHSMVYDPVTHLLIMFGGRYKEGVGLDDIWAYAAATNTWTELKPSGTLPSPRFKQASAHDPTTRCLVMFGGRSDTDLPCDDTWTYDPASNTWTELKPSGTLPPARSGHSMVYDPVTHRLVMFGGRDDTGTALGDTWAYDSAANTWTELKPSGTLPSARSGHSMAYDLASGRLVMFGGQDAAGVTLRDTWAYDAIGKAWIELEPSRTSPSARGGQALVYDPAGGQLIMFGGSAAGSFHGDIWTCAPGS
jgi:N-acetylneuraminic acid mutarotase